MKLYFGKKVCLSVSSGALGRGKLSGGSVCELDLHSKLYTSKLEHNFSSFSTSSVPNIPFCGITWLCAIQEGRQSCSTACPGGFCVPGDTVARSQGQVTMGRSLWAGRQETCTGVHKYLRRHKGIAWLSLSLAQSLPEPCQSLHRRSSFALLFLCLLFQ